MMLTTNVALKARVMPRTQNVRRTQAQRFVVRAAAKEEGESRVAQFGRAAFAAVLAMTMTATSVEPVFAKTTSPAQARKGRAPAASAGAKRAPGVKRAVKRVRSKTVAAAPAKKATASAKKTSTYTKRATKRVRSAKTSAAAPAARKVAARSSKGYTKRATKKVRSKSSAAASSTAGKRKTTSPAQRRR